MGVFGHKSILFTTPSLSSSDTTGTALYNDAISDALNARL